SFLRPEHERMIRQALADLPVSMSDDVLGEFREYERASTTVLDAYVKPLVTRYLANLKAAIERDFCVMKSGGGVVSQDEVSRRRRWVLGLDRFWGAVACRTDECGSGSRSDRLRERRDGRHGDGRGPGRRVPRTKSPRRPTRARRTSRTPRDRKARGPTPPLLGRDHPRGATGGAGVDGQGDAAGPRSARARPEGIRLARVRRRWADARMGPGPRARCAGRAR